MTRIPLLLVTRPGIGGAAKHVRMLCELISKDSFDVTVAASPLEDPAFLDILAATGVRVIPLPMRREPHPSDAGALWRLARLLRRVRPSIVHAHTSKPGLLARLAAAASGLPALYTPHGFYFHYDIPAWKRALYRGIERLAGPWTARLVCVTEEEARQAAGARLVPPGRIAVIPNALRPEECVPKRSRAEVRAELGIPADAPLLVMVGRLAPPKDPFTLVVAAARIPGVHVLFAGDGPQRDGLRALARELDCDARVHTPGHRADAIDLTAAADVAVLSSRWEGLPYALLEAMAVGLPVVASDISGCRDALGGTGAGRLVPVGDTAAMRTAIDAFLSNPRAREAAGRAGRALVAEKYGAARWIARMEELYRTLG